MSNVSKKSKITTEDIVRELLAKETSHIVKFDPQARRGDAEGIHQLRVGARRLRSELVVVAPALKTRPRKQLRSDLAWVGSVLGAPRDFDVLLDLLTSNHGTPLLLKQSPVIEAIDRGSATEHRRVAVALDSPRYRRLAATLAEYVVAPPLTAKASKPAYKVLLPGLVDAIEHCFEIGMALGDDATGLELHQLRIAAKRARYDTEISAYFLGPAMNNLADRFAEIQTILGDMHDRYVAIGFIRNTMSWTRQGAAPDGITGPEQSAIVALKASIEAHRNEWKIPFAEARSLAHSLLPQLDRARS
jgi:CHAD domain-containing protein